MHDMVFLQLSCAPFSSSIRDKSVFRNFFQLLPSDEENAQIFFSVIKAFGFKLVGLIVQEERQFLEVAIAISLQL